MHQAAGQQQVSWPARQRTPCTKQQPDSPGVVVLYGLKVGVEGSLRVGWSDEPALAGWRSADTTLPGLCGTAGNTAELW